MDIKTIDDSQAQKTFEVTVSALKIEEYFKQGAENLSKKFSIKGFRNGNAPFNIVAREVGEKEAYKEVISLALNSLLPDFFANQKLYTLGEPEIEVLKIAPSNPFIFKIIVSIYPEFTIPSLNNIEIKSKKVFVSDKEVDKSIEYLKKARKAENIDDKFAQSLGNFKNLEKMKKTEDELAKEQKDLAKMKIINSLILAKLAKEHSIKVEIQEVNQQIEFILSKNNITLDKLGKDLNIEQFKSNIFQQILNEKIFTQVLDKYIVSS